MLGKFSYSFIWCHFFSKIIFRNTNNQGVKQFESSILSGLIWVQTFFAKVISRQQKPLLVGKELQPNNPYPPECLCKSCMRPPNLGGYLLSAANSCKQFGPISGPTKCLAWPGSKPFSWKIFLNFKFSRWQKRLKNAILPSIMSLQREDALNEICCFVNKKIIKSFLKLIACFLILHAFFVVCWYIFFFQIKLFHKILSEIPSECHTVWIQIRPNILSGLIWVHPVWKDYQQITTSRGRVNSLSASVVCW